MQTKKNSLIESITNTISGFVISLLIQLLIYPIMGIPVNFHQNIIITIAHNVKVLCARFNGAKHVL